MQNLKHAFPRMTLVRVAIVAGLVGLSSFELVSPACGQDAAAKQPEFRGLGSCALCHNQGLTADALLPLNRDFCALNEMPAFLKNDKHGQAFELLKGDLGQHMQTILARAKGDPDYKVTNDEKCLSCHANWHWKEGFDKPPFFEYGVTCESCHGPSSLWNDPHAKVEWRQMSPEQKEQEYGFIDVRNPIRRAKQCFSCHIGSVAEGRVVTHDMYAAGHPPLPGIEIETFTSEMPTHWRLLREKGEFQLRDEYIAANYANQKPLEDLPRTKSVLIGGVVALRETLNMFSRQAVEGGADSNDDSHWPELAMFDCSACHHDLKYPAWRQERGYGAAVPGRPQMFEWPTALVEVGIRHRAGDDNAAFTTQSQAFHSKLEGLRRVLDRRPFGAPAAIAEVVDGDDGLIAWLDQLAEDIRLSTVEEADARRALGHLVSLKEDAYPDYHSARQVLWAVRSIQSELTVNGFPELKARPAEETQKESVQRGVDNLLLFNTWWEGPRADAERQVNELLAQLELMEKMRLDLPGGVDDVIGKQLSISLDAIGGYDPAWFRRQLKELATKVDK